MAQQDLVYRSMSPMLGQQDFGEAGLFNQTEAIKKASIAGRMQMAQQVVDGTNKLIINEFQNNMNNQLMQAYRDNASNPVEFQKNAKAIEDGLLKETPLHMRGDLRAAFQQKANGFYNQTVNNEIKVNDDRNKEQLLIKQNNSIELAQNAVNQILDTNPDIQLQGNNQLSVAALDFANSLNETDSMGQPVFNANQRFKALDDFRGSIFSQFASQKMNSLPTIQEKQKFLSDLYSGKETLKIGDVELSGKNLSQQQINALEKRLKEDFKAFALEMKDASSREYINNVIQGKEIADPKDKDYRGSVDTYYKEQVNLKNIDPSDPSQREQAANTVSKFIYDVKTIPPSLEGELRAMLNSDNPDYFALASSITGSISSNNPELMQYLPQKDISKALRMSDLVSTGMSSEQAYSSVKESFKLMPKDVVDQRIKDFNKMVDNNPDSVNPSTMEHGFWFFREMKQPATTLESETFTNQLKTLAREEYAKGADYNDAIKSAKLMMLNRWGNSNINGKDQLMALPPEKFYAVDEVGINSKWMKDKAVNFAKEISKDSTLNSNNLIITADKTTYQQAGDRTTKPTYALLSLKNGLINPILDKDLNIVRVGENIWRDNEALDMYNAPERKQKEEIKRILDEISEASFVKKSKDREMKNKMTLEYQKAQFAPFL